MPDNFLSLLFFCSVLAISSLVLLCSHVLNCEWLWDCVSFFKKTLAAPNLDDDGHLNVFGPKIKVWIGIVIGFHMSPCSGL